MLGSKFRALSLRCRVFGFGFGGYRDISFEKGFVLDIWGCMTGLYRPRFLLKVLFEEVLGVSLCMVRII